MANCADDAPHEPSTPDASGGGDADSGLSTIRRSIEQRDAGARTGVAVDAAARMVEAARPKNDPDEDASVQSSSVSQADGGGSDSNACPTVVKPCVERIRKLHESCIPEAATCTRSRTIETPVGNQLTTKTTRACYSNGSSIEETTAVQIQPSVEPARVFESYLAKISDRDKKQCYSVEMIVANDAAMRDVLPKRYIVRDEADAVMMEMVQEEPWLTAMRVSCQGPIEEVSLLDRRCGGDALFPMNMPYVWGQPFGHGEAPELPVPGTIADECQGDCVE